MTTVRLLYNVGDDVKGAVIRIDDLRALRLTRTGYAVVVEEATTVQPSTQRKKKAKE